MSTDELIFDGTLQHADEILVLRGTVPGIEDEWRKQIEVNGGKVDGKGNVMLVICPVPPPPPPGMGHGIIVDVRTRLSHNDGLIAAIQEKLAGDMRNVLRNNKCHPIPKDGRLVLHFPLPKTK